MPSMSNTEWSGILRYSLPALLWILVFSIITFGLSIAYGKDVRRHDHHTSTATLVFYLGTMPFLTTLSTLFTAFLHFTSRLTHTIALIVAVTFTVGWVVQLAMWGQCEIEGPGIDEVQLSYCPDTGSDGLTIGKLSTACAVITGYLVIIGLAAYGVKKVKKTQANEGMMQAKALDGEDTLTDA